MDRFAKKKIYGKTHIMMYVPKSIKYILTDAVGRKKDKVIHRGYTLKVHNLLDIINHFLYQRAFYKKDMTNISATVLKKKFGKHYNKYVSYLTERNILYLESNHQKGIKCRTYSMRPKIYTEVRNRILIKDNIYLKKWRNRKLSYLTGEIATEMESNIPPYVLSKLVGDLYHVDIDDIKAQKEIERQIKNKDINKDSYWKNTISVDNLKDGSLFYTLDSFGRFHTNFTILKTCIRNKFLSINNSEVNNVDIKNSQPLFLTVIMKETGFDNTHPVEYKRFEKHVKSGTIYEQLSKTTGYTREKCKKLIYNVFFDESINYGDKKYFINLYPEIWKWMGRYKKDKGNYKVLSHRLQELESNLIFCNIIPEIINKDPSIRMFTVHDAIYFPKEHTLTIETIFNKHLDKTFN